MYAEYLSIFPFFMLFLCICDIARAARNFFLQVYHYRQGVIIIIIMLWQTWGGVHL